MSPRAAALCAAALCAVSCSRSVTLVDPEPSLERMLDQPRTDPFEESDLFSDGRAMRTPPTGTVPRERVLGPASLIDGREGGRHVDRIPVPVTRALLEHGRERFETFCAACHGVLGDGRSPVAEAMTLRSPPSLHEPRLRAAPPGQLFEVATRGYGLMPSYAPYLPVASRWAVVAYVRALQLSRSAPVASLPDDLRHALEGMGP